jgi:exopolyphosphatase/guanosine-5'-triphosphate,3'-diphosphate pyrophosphatase
VRILTGHEEARIIFTAIRRRLDIGSETTLGLDLGGGSFEFALGNARTVHWESTLPLGVTRLQGQLIEEDRRGRIPYRQMIEVRARVRRLVRPLRARIQAAQPARVVAVGGTVRALARLATRGRSGDADLTGLELRAAELQALGLDLARETHAERLRMRGMNPRRADLLPIGAAVLAAALRELELPAVTCCDWGLREGIALQLLERPHGRSVPRPSRSRASRGKTLSRPRRRARPS